MRAVRRKGWRAARTRRQIIRLSVGRYRPGQPEALVASFGRIFTTAHGFNRLGDVVLRRDEAVRTCIYSLSCAVRAISSRLGARQSQRLGAGLPDVDRVPR